MKDAGRGTFAELLRQHRTAVGLTQEELADRAGLSVRGIADLERGVRRLPHFHTLRSLAQALELSPEDRVALLAAGQRPGRTRPAEVPSVPAWHCGRCERDNTPEAGFCVDCGVPREVTCPACGALGRSADRFCHACGVARGPGPGDAAQPPVTGAGARATAPPESPASAPPERLASPEGEHKQATVLFCQLADADVLARSLGPEGMLAFLDSFFEQAEAEVRRFEGNVSSYLSDGLVALFGVPVAHEDHARRGVLVPCGPEIIDIGRPYVRPTDPCRVWVPG